MLQPGDLEKNRRARFAFHAAWRIDKTTFLCYISGNSSSKYHDMAASESAVLPAGSNLKALLQQPAQALDFVLPGFLRGTVGGLVAPGGTGKSMWALALGVAISGGAKADLTGLNPTTGRVLYLNAEDPEVVLASRLKAMAAQLPRQASLAQLDHRDCLGLGVDLMQKSWFESVLAQAKDARLVILDTLSRFHCLDENSTQDMKALVAQLEKLARLSGASVLYLHHTSKLAALSGQAGLAQAARGSSVLTDNARWAAFMAPMTEAQARPFGIPADEVCDYVRWNISKQNYGASTPDRWYRRAQGGVLMPVELRPRKSAPVPASRPAAFNGMTAQITQTHTPEAVLPSANNAFNGQW